MNSQFAMNQNAYRGMQPTQQAPASPPRGFGYVAGVASETDNLNGYIGGKPPQKEEPQNPQSRRQNINFASPDPTLAQTAFCQSQFTTNLLNRTPNGPNGGGGGGGACSTGSCPMPNGGNGNVGGGEEPLTADEIRRENLRKFKESNGGRVGGGGGGFATGHPSLTSQRQQQQQSVRNNVNNRAGGQFGAGGGGARQGLPDSAGNNNNSPASEYEAEANNNGSSSSSGSSFVAYPLSDPGSLYKAFTGSHSWFRVMHIIVPEGKRLKRIHFASMLVAKRGDETVAADGCVYSVRLVDTQQQSAQSR